MLLHRSIPAQETSLTSASLFLLQMPMSDPEREKRSVRVSTPRAAGASQERLP